MATKKKAAPRKKAAGSKASSKKATTKKTAAKKTASKKKATKKSASQKKTGAPKSSDDSGAWFEPTIVEREIGGRILSLETGRMAKQADGAILARYGDTIILATAQSAKGREGIDFLPLTVDYREKASAAGKFPGGFFKREGRPTAREILCSRIIDRAIRPLFPDGFRDEVQVLVQVMSTDQENESDILGAVAAFAALAISTIPHEKVLGACRVGLHGEKLIVNPTWSEVQSEDNLLNLTVAAHDSAIVMVEAGAKQVPEDTMLEALELGHEVCREVVELIEDLVEAAGKPKTEFVPPEKNEKLRKSIEKKFGKQLANAPFDGATKHEKGAAKTAALEAVHEAFPPPADATDKEAAAHKAEVSGFAKEMIDGGIRDQILQGNRLDGRGPADIRPIAVEVDVMPRCHGSSLFTRGETQALCTATLGTRDDEQFMDGIYPEDRKRFMLHYNFPPFCVGEVRRFGFVGRREIGHGALAERSIESMLPSHEEFPYTLRVTSEILESNGSSSMATVCGATLCLMDAGVPLRQPVAGIAMGLVKEGKKVAILSDILGTEDHCGDMDFKVTGTGKGINALQMDIKCEGLTRKILEDALEQARKGRLHILREMLRVIRSPREELSPNAPRLETIKVPSDKIGLLIGPGGRNVRQMQEDYEVRVHISDDGTVQVAGSNSEKVLACMQRIGDTTAEVELNKVYKGRVTSIKEFGAFIEILPGQEGLCHVSELSDEFIRAVTDVVRIGDEVEVKVIDIDDFGKVKLSRRVLQQGGGDGAGAAGDEGERPRGRRRERDDEDREERPRRGRREEREEREERPRRGRRDDSEEREERPRRGRREEREEREDRDDRPRRGRRDREEREDRDDRPRRGRRDEREDREDREDRPHRGRREERGDREERDDRPRRGRRDEREDREERASGRGRGRDRDDREDRDARDERPRRGRGRDRDDREDREERPRRGRGRDRDDDREERGGRGRRDRDDRDDGHREERGGRSGRGRDDRDDRDDRPRGRQDRDGDESRGRGRGRREEVETTAAISDELESPDALFGDDSAGDSGGRRGGGRGRRPSSGGGSRRRSRRD